MPEEPRQRRVLVTPVMESLMRELGLDLIEQHKLELVGTQLMPTYTREGPMGQIADMTTMTLWLKEPFGDDSVHKLVIHVIEPLGGLNG